MYITTMMLNTVTALKPYHCTKKMHSAVSVWTTNAATF